MSQLDPYDEVPYRSFPVEWTAPERLALASFLHGGPVPALQASRVLELGCGDGANVLPLACHRQHSWFVGVDGSADAIAAASAARSELGLDNVAFVCAPFSEAAAHVDGTFDVVIAHGVLSWVDDEQRDALLALCSHRLRHGGLLYVNYNALPGWRIRGMVREFLLEQTRRAGDLRARAEASQAVASTVAANLPQTEHPYTRLLADEFDFVRRSHPSYVAHEFLAADNHAYWRSDFMLLARAHGFEYVADADFNYSSGRVPETLEPWLKAEGITGRSLDNTVDLLCYRQMHSPILTPAPFVRTEPSVREFGNLWIASPLTRCGAQEHPAMFRHPSGYEVEAKEPEVEEALKQLARIWPRGLRNASLFRDVAHVVEDLRLLHRNQLIELRLVEPTAPEGCDGLRRFESEKGGYFTTPYHTREAVAALPVR